MGLSCGRRQDADPEPDGNVQSSTGLLLLLLLLATGRAALAEKVLCSGGRNGQALARCFALSCSIRGYGTPTRATKGGA